MPSPTNDQIEGSLSSRAFFGDGDDGDVVISSNTTLTRRMFYNNLTVNATFALTLARHDIAVAQTLTNNGTIRDDGSAGGDAAGTAAGPAGPALPDDDLGGGAAGGAGGAGGVGGNGTASFPGNPGGAATGMGGAGSVGGASSKAGGAAGTRTLAPWRIPFAMPLRDGSVRIKGGAGSGGGGGGNGSGTGNGGGGGGGGGGGAWARIRARDIVNNGSITAKGGDGGDGADASSGTEVGGGGGSGGPGGVMDIVYETFSPVGTITAAGGAKGLKGNFGAPSDGVAGNVGVVLRFNAATGVFE